MPASFWSALPVLDEFAEVTDLARYQPLPDGWSLALADVVSSGTAIAEGKYKMVNMAGASVITAVLNATGPDRYPFVFGGDGAAIAIPPAAEAQARGALAAVARWISDDLGLAMRVAVVPVAAIRAAGHDVRVARHRASPAVSFAMFAGGGSAWAEARMKAGAYLVDMAPPGVRPDLTGLSCRWNPVQAQRGQIVSIIAVATRPGVGDGFRALVSAIVAIANQTGSMGNPLLPDGPRPGFHLGGVDAEARATMRPGRRLSASLKVIATMVLTLASHRMNLTFGGFNARSYVRDMARNTDFRKFDDALKMTIDVDDTQLAQLKACLADASDDGICTYGLHCQDSALVTCFVPSASRSDHIHFIDGAAGGYAQAAIQMKAKIAGPAAV